MTMSRRAFLGSLGAGAAALAFGGISLPAAGTTDAAAVLEQTLQVGDVFTIAGRYALNPITRTPSAHLQEFVITAIVGPTITVSPASTRSVRSGRMNRSMR